MELKNKGNTHADSTIEETLSNDDMAGREAALSFSGEDMTKAAAKRQAQQASIFLSAVLHVGVVSCTLQAQLCKGRAPVLQSHAPAFVFREWEPGRRLPDRRIIALHVAA